MAYYIEVATDFRSEVKRLQEEAMKEDNQINERVVGSLATLRVNSEGVRCLGGSCLDS